MNTLCLQYFAEQEGWIVDWRDGQAAPCIDMIHPQLKPLESGKGYAGIIPGFEIEQYLKNKPPE